LSFLADVVHQVVAKNAGASKRAALIAKRLKLDFAMIYGEQTEFAESLSEEVLYAGDGSLEAAGAESLGLDRSMPKGGWAAAAVVKPGGDGGAAGGGGSPGAGAGGGAAAAGGAVAAVVAGAVATPPATPPRPTKGGGAETGEAATEVIEEEVAAGHTLIGNVEGRPCILVYGVCFVLAFWFSLHRIEAAR
jgi:phosphoribosylpyrophosphate synthetase